jgi:hypothetical protein
MDTVVFVVVCPFCFLSCPFGKSRNVGCVYMKKRECMYICKVFFFFFFFFFFLVVV